MSLLRSQLEFYAVYHHNPINKAIHFVFVPTILWTVLVWLSLLPWTTSVSFLFISPASLLYAAYSIFYILLDPLAGTSWACCVGLPMLLYAQKFALVPNAWAWAAALHVFSWYMQIHPGHAIFERRKPALMDSLVQAFATAPLFVWMELLFLLGYRRGLQEDLEHRVSKALAGRRAQ